MIDRNHLLAALLLIVLPRTVSAASLADKFTLGAPYYFNGFDPGQKPWDPGQHLNLEEVFKNYQYYEIVFDQDGNGITVNQFLRGSKESSERYLLLQDRSLRKK